MYVCIYVTLIEKTVKGDKELKHREKGDKKGYEKILYISLHMQNLGLNIFT